jgi:hypothetical protein
VNYNYPGLFEFFEVGILIFEVNPPQADKNEAHLRFQTTPTFAFCCEQPDAYHVFLCNSSSLVILPVDNL